MDEDWFEVDVDVNDRNQKLIAVVRESARFWPECPPNATSVLVSEPDETGGESRGGDGVRDRDPYDIAIDEALADGEQVLLLAVDLCDLEENRVFGTLGATVVKDRLFCSQRHTTTYRPEPSDDVESLEAIGSLTELGRIAAGWFEEVVRRPVIGPIGHGAGSFVAPCTTPPPRYRWIRNAPDAKQVGPATPVVTD
ncbi:hypothetical protein [Streptomyces sp900105755]|uniref:Uncharacterized protein n=1 Tax=Streptomyces sp. 900105755 TaxID=3154389 RepID=A0ABV1T8U3_9ACTN